MYGLTKTISLDCFTGEGKDGMYNIYLFVFEDYCQSQGRISCGKKSSLYKSASTRFIRCCRKCMAVVKFVFMIINGTIGIDVIID
jgi:hypothetical protein